jgi:hypothetical protein
LRVELSIGHHGPEGQEQPFHYFRGRPPNGSTKPTRRRSGRLWFVPELKQSAPADIGEFSQARFAASRALDEMLGNKLSISVISAIRQSRTDFFEHNVHIPLNAFVKFGHALLPLKYSRERI